MPRELVNVVALGCGELPWGRPYASPLLGRKWKRGRLRDGIQSTASGFLAGGSPGHDSIRLADEIDRLDAWLPVRPVGPAAKLVVSGHQAAEAPPLPGWAEFAGTQARWVTRQLKGAGVLVTPGAWLLSDKGRQVLEAWAGEGWSWVALEKAVTHHDTAPAPRMVAAAGLWLRSIEEGEDLVCANGAAAARAVEIGAQALDFALGQLDGALAQQWRQEEDPQTGWFVRQLIIGETLAALAGGRTSFELGGDGPLFRFSSAAAGTRFQLLASLRLRVEAPPAAVAWWDLVSRPGGLRDARGALHTGLRWRERKTLLLDAPQTRPLAEHLSRAGLAYELLDPAGLEGAVDLGAPLPPRVAAAPPPPLPPSPAAALDSPSAGQVVAFVRRADAAAPPAAAAVAAPAAGAGPGPVLPGEGDHLAPAPAAVAAPPPVGAKAAAGEVALGTYQPDRFTLATPHRPDHMQVWVDGKRIEQGNVRRMDGPGRYLIAGPAVPHRAVVRIDFEPAQG